MQERQRGFFDAENHEASHARFKNPLEELNKIIAWDDFVPIFSVIKHVAKKLPPEFPTHINEPIL